MVVLVAILINPYGSLHPKNTCEGLTIRSITYIDNPITITPNLQVTFSGDTWGGTLFKCIILTKDKKVIRLYRGQWGWPGVNPYHRRRRIPRLGIRQIRTMDLLQVIIGAFQMILGLQKVHGVFKLVCKSFYFSKQKDCNRINNKVPWLADSSQ